MKRALICGIGGQDGAYLARLLLGQGYHVLGTSRDAAAADLAKLDRLGIRAQVELRSMAPTDFRSVHAAIEWAQPDEIYALAGQSSVGLSFEMPAETLESIVLGTLNLLEAVRLSARDARIYHASSSECFGDLGRRPAREDTAFRPCSPYGVAKTSAHLLVASYRQAYDLFAANGILFNHESPLRPERFVTRKITAAVARITAGSGERLRLGRLDIVRDWGWASEYVEAMWRILQADEPDDFIVATGQSHSLEAFTQCAFAAAGLDWRDHVDTDPALGRPADLAWSGGLPEKASQVLGWQAQTWMAQVAAGMVNADRAGSGAVL